MVASQDYERSPQTSKETVSVRDGVHTIRSGFSDLHNPTVPRRYVLDNGNYKENMKITRLELIPNSGALTTNNHDVASPIIMYFVLATSAAGATPLDNNNSSDENVNYGLRLQDSRQIGWGFIDESQGYHRCFVDPEHIVPNDLYVNAYSLGDTGTPTTLGSGLSFMIVMERVKESGAQGLLQAVKQITQDATN